MYWRPRHYDALRWLPERAKAALAGVGVLSRSPYLEQTLQWPCDGENLSCAAPFVHIRAADGTFFTPLLYPTFFFLQVPAGCTGYFLAHMCQSSLLLQLNGGGAGKWGFGGRDVIAAWEMTLLSAKPFCCKHFLFPWENAIRRRKKRKSRAVLFIADSRKCHTFLLPSIMTPGCFLSFFIFLRAWGSLFFSSFFFFLCRSCRMYRHMTVALSLSLVCGDNGLSSSSCVRSLFGRMSLC